MKKLLAIMIMFSLTLFAQSVPANSSEAAEEETAGSATTQSAADEDSTTDNAHAVAGELVCLNDMNAAFEPELFTAGFDNPDLVKNSIKYPLPAQGELYLLRFALTEDSEALTREIIENEIAPVMQLRAASNGDTGDVNRVVTPDDGETRIFDLIFYCENYHELSDMELLCDDVLYQLDGLPRDGEILLLPTVEETAIDKLNALHVKAINEGGQPIDQAACTGNVIVAYYTDSDEDATPQVFTAESVDERDFPREYRAEDYDSARWAALIYPTYVNVGFYGGGYGPANRTITWLSLFDLETEEQYTEKFATEEPPQTITVETFNGFAIRTGASGEYHGEEVFVRLTGIVETARTAPGPTP